MNPITDIIAKHTGENSLDVFYDTDVSVRNLIRSVMNREYGVIQQSAYCTGALERTRAQMIDFIMALRALALNAGARVLVGEADILRVCSCIKRLELQGYKNLTFIQDFCTRRASRDPMEYHECDPLQLRHLLTFSIDVPNYDMPQEELSLIECHLAEGDSESLMRWFERHANSGVAHNKSLPAYLRRFIMDYPEAPLAAVKTFAFELAVMDVRISGALGWENARTFYSTMCLVQDRRHDPLEAYMDDREINAGVLIHQHSGDAEGRTYFAQRLDTFDPADLKSLEQMVFDAASRNDRSDSGPRSGKKQAAEKRSWWKSIFAPSGAAAQGFSAGAMGSA